MLITFSQNAFSIGRLSPRTARSCILQHFASKEVSSMFSSKRSGILRSFGVFVTFLFVLVFASDAAAQCYCKTSHHHSRKRTVSTHKTTYAVRGYSAYNPATPSYRMAFNSSDHGTTSNYVVVTNGYRRGYNPELVDEEGPISFDPNYMDTARIGRDYGFHDGLKKGYFAALERKAYYPEKHGRYKSGTRGYKGRFGNKQIYRESYREGFIRGYRSGYRSVASRETLRAARNY